MKNIFTLLIITTLFSAKLCVAQFNNSTLITKIFERDAGIISATDTLNFNAATIDGTSQLIQVSNTVNGSSVDMLITKYRRNGNIGWQKHWNNAGGGDYATVVVTDASNNIYIGGMSYVSSGNGYDLVVLKYDSSGNYQWSYFKNGSANSYDITTDLKLYGGYVYACGVVTRTTTGQDYCTVKLNTSGTQQWVSYYDYSNYTDIPACLSIYST
jgi:hypothetical protein